MTPDSPTVPEPAAAAPAATPRTAVVVGGGPAGLMAAEVLLAGGVRVELYEAMPSVGRKFLLAGRGGLNLTHAEPHAAFERRYGARSDVLAPLLAAFPPQALRAWVHALGIETFVGTSQRVFPVGMKAAPLLRAWLRRLREAGLQLHVRHRWTGWDDAGLLRFESPDGAHVVAADALVLALGGASWPRFGSDGRWVPWLAGAGAEVAPLVPANCGFDVGWSEHLRTRFAGAPVKSVSAWCDGAAAPQRGEFVVTEHGVEGSLVYALSAVLRDRIAADGQAVLHLDLAPDRSLDSLAEALGRPAGGKSLANQLRARAGIDGIKAALLRECTSRAVLDDGARIAAAIKDLPVTLRAPRPIAEAISTAGGVRFESLDPALMLGARPGVFCAGEMLDWEAPTGGYLLTACLATGRRAGEGALDWLRTAVR